MEVKKKKCSKCGEVKFVEEFRNNKSNKDGFSYWCKTCLSESRKLDYKKHKDKIKEYRDLNKERIRETEKSHYKKNKKRLNAESREYYKKNRDKILELTKKYQEENKDKIRQKAKIYYKKNKKKRNAKCREYAEELSDGYIAVRIGISAKDIKYIPPELIELKRNIIKLKRAKNEKIN